MADQTLIERTAKAIMEADGYNDEMDRWHQFIPQAKAALSVIQGEIPVISKAEIKGIISQAMYRIDAQSLEQAKVPSIESSNPQYLEGHAEAIYQAISPYLERGCSEISLPDRNTLKREVRDGLYETKSLGMKEQRLAFDVIDFVLGRIPEPKREMIKDCPECNGIGWDISPGKTENHEPIQVPCPVVI